MANTNDSLIGSGGASEAEMAAMGVFYLILGIFVVIAYVVYAFFLSKVFKKAGVESWKAWVPVYNQWVFFELGDQKGWISLLSLLGVIPFVGLIPALVAYVYSVIAAYKIGLKFGKDGVFVLLYIFLQFVWVIWLAVDKTALWNGGGKEQAVGQASTAAPYQPEQSEADSTNTPTPPTYPSQQPPTS